jgi:hypothetical protein
MQDVAEKILLFTDINELRQLIEAYKNLGVARIFLHNINRQQEEFIEDFGDR